MPGSKVRLQPQRPNQPETRRHDVMNLYWDQYVNIHPAQCDRRNVRILHEDGWFSDGTITFIELDQNSGVEGRTLKAVAPILKCY